MMMYIGNIGAASTLRNYITAIEELVGAYYEELGEVRGSCRIAKPPSPHVPCLNSHAHRRRRVVGASRAPCQRVLGDSRSPDCGVHACMHP